MNKLYRAIGIGAISLSSMFSQQAKIQQVKPPEAQTKQYAESKLESILSGFISSLESRLNEKEIAVNEYEKLFLDNYHHAQSQGLVLIPTMYKLIDRKLSTKTLYGLNDDYLVLKQTPISNVARNDIEQYKKLKNDGIEYLKQKASQKQLTSKGEEKLIDEFLQSNKAYASISAERRSQLRWLQQLKWDISFGYAKFLVGLK